MKSFYDKIDDVLDILSSDSSSMKDLARISGRDLFSFYRGADLSGLDLSGQDLTGLNFERANFKSANLKNITFDIGAFNGSEMPTAYQNLIDEYDGYLSDILLPQMERISFYAQIRPESIEALFSETGTSFSAFASDIGINLDTLRRARRDYVISAQTLLKIASGMKKTVDNWLSRGQGPYSSSFKQPMIRFLSLKPQGGFSYISQRDVTRILDLSTRLDLTRYGDLVSPDQLRSMWRSRPETLMWMANYYDYVDFDRMPSFDEQNQLDLNT